MKNNLTGGKPPKEMTILETHENNLKEFDEKFYSLTKQTCLWHRNFDLRLFLTSSTKAILESLKGDLDGRMAKLKVTRRKAWIVEYRDGNGHATFGDHKGAMNFRDGWNSALSDISAIINKAIEEIK